jgi:hypothetical protein
MMIVGDRWLAWVGCVLAACGPGVANEGTSDGSSSRTSEETSVLSTEATAETTALPSECDPFADASEPGTPITIEIVNVGDDPVLLDSPCPGFAYLALTTASGWEWPGGFCEHTCEERFSFGCGACGPCPETSYTVVMPGRAAQVEWPGHLYALARPPETCFYETSCTDACPQRRVDLFERIDIAVVAVSYEDCVGTEGDASVCSCADADATTCMRSGTQRIEPSLEGTAIYEPSAPGPIVVEIDG